MTKMENVTISVPEEKLREMKKLLLDGFNPTVLYTGDLDEMKEQAEHISGQKNLEVRLILQVILGDKNINIEV